MSTAYHITTIVSDLIQSKKFYDGLFDALGWSISFDDEFARAYSDGSFDYWIVQSEVKTSRPSKSGPLGFDHLAIRVEQKEKVDTLYTWLLANDAKIDIAPRAYPNYSEHYYAVFFYDPDGSRLEVVYN